jgi:hypothetical protein
MSKVRVVGLLALLAATATTGVAAAGVLGPGVVSDRQIGPLQLNKSGRAAIVRFAGVPQYSGGGGLQYDCTPRTGCNINYFLRTAGRMKGKLVAVVIGAGRFATASGITIGMTRAQALAREPHAIRARFCGLNVLRDRPLSNNRADHWVGLNISLYRGKVDGFDIFSSHVKITCAGRGAWRIWN